ncbi:Uncharacterized protein FWK35_00029949 [Aphis craccivora]|uniref:MADF domain-containing protein n=1 Tax=Aphis craccivora TaxID=307492 RepID=A0A6G0VYQ2_APHCR|nr:Uncharacterized protein FWK35_00029949 [Aphis craccivora]
MLLTVEKPTRETLKNKWKNLRDSYQKYLKANSTTTGQAAGPSKGVLDPYKNWIWAKHLEFLRPHLKFVVYAKTIKTFSPIRQAIAKKKNSEIISDLEIEEIAENEQNKRYYSHTENYHGIPSHSQDPDPYLYPAVQDSEQNAINLTVEKNHFGDKYSNSSFDNRYTQL